MFIQKVIHVGILKAPSNAKCISASVIILNYKNIRGEKTIPNEHVQFLSKYCSSHEHHLPLYPFIIDIAIYTHCYPAD